MSTGNPSQTVAALVLAAAGLGLGLAAGPAGGSAASPGSRCARHFPPVIHDGFPEPPARFSHAGRLSTTLRASVGPVNIGGRRIRTMNYEGVYPSPTLVVCPGDRLDVRLVNDLPDPTNLHLHGLHVAPGGSSDNVFLDIRPGHSFDYHYRLPRDHPPGAYWYHPHHHMHVENQIFAGMAGAIVVEGGLDDLMPRIPQRLMVLTNTELTSAGGTVPGADSSDRNARIYVNGALNPTVNIRPGQVQRWRIFNADADRIVVLRIAGHVMDVLAKDGNTLAAMRPTRDLMIGPGSRREVLVRGGAKGIYAMRVLPFTQRPSTVLGGQDLLTLRSSGPPAHDHLPPGPLNRPVDLRGQHVDRRRRIDFTEMTAGSADPTFQLNNRMFDPDRVDVTMKLGSLEEWTLVNSTDEWHSFHIHINPFQVVSVAGRTVPYVDYQDNVVLAPRSSTVIRMRPVDFTGKFVLHCHVTFHEDRGMMAAVQVVKKLSASRRSASAVRDGGLSIRSSAYGSARLPRQPAVAVLRMLCRLLRGPIGH